MAWANCFLRHIVQNEPGMREHVTQASQRYLAIHDLMWDVWAVSRGINNKEAWRSFRGRDARREVSAITGQAQILDREAMEHIQQALQQQE